MALTFSFSGFQSPFTQSLKDRPTTNVIRIPSRQVKLTHDVLTTRGLYYQNSLRLYRHWNEVCGVNRAVSLSPGYQEVGNLTTADGTNVFAEISENNKLKMKVHVSGIRTKNIFDDVFAKLVDAAQPIPGFRRIKGGKTVDIPKEILLLILGPSKVKRQSINKLINSIVAEYVEKKCLDVSKDLRVEESYEDLEASFEPGDDFSFNAVIQLKETS